MSAQQVCFDFRKQRDRDPLLSIVPVETGVFGILSDWQRRALQSALAGRLIALCFGAGVDSTAMLLVLRDAGIVPHIITFADTGGEKPPTLRHLHAMRAILRSWGWPDIDICRKTTLASTPYSDLYGNCIANETLPSLAFGLKSCSIKWKQEPQDQFIKGVQRGPNRRPPHPIWIEALNSGSRIVKLLGYDCGRADLRRSKNLSDADEDFDYFYPLQLIGYTRKQCVYTIVSTLGARMLPIKSACFFCPASKIWELYWLAAHYPDLFEQALVLERVALTGRHSRFDEVEFGASWEDLVRNADSFPSTDTTVGLGRKFSWNQWAVVNGVVDDQFHVRRELCPRFAALADAMLDEDDNALDARACSRRQHHEIAPRQGAGEIRP